MTKDSAKDYAGEPAAPDVTTIKSREITAARNVTAHGVTKEINMSFSGCAFLGTYEVGTQHRSFSSISSML